MKSIKHRILLTTGLLVGITATGIKVNANDDLTPVNQSSESSTTTAANSTATTEAASTTATPATADKQVSWQTPQSADTSADTSQTNNGYGNQNSTAGTTQTTGSPGQETTVDPAQSAGVQNSQPTQTSDTQSLSTQDTQTQPTTSQAQTASSTGVSNGSQTSSTNNQQAASQQVQAPTSAASIQETNQTSSVNNSVTSNQSTSQNTTGTVSNTSNNGQTATVQSQSASSQKATSQSEKKSDTKATSQSKDDTKRAAANKTTHKSKSKATDNQRATQKTYIFYHDVNPNDPNEYGKIIYSDVIGGQTKYYEYNERTDKFSLITDAAMIEEVKGAFSDKKVTKHYMDSGELEQALQDNPDVENVGEYRIITTHVDPGDIESIYDTIRSYHQLGDGATNRYVINIDDEYYAYDEKTEKFDIENPVTDDVNKAIDAEVLQHQYADSATLKAIKEAFAKDPELATYQNYDVKIVEKLPEGITEGLYFVIHNNYENEYSTPSNPARGSSIVPVYFDGYHYHKFNATESKFERLTVAEREELSAAEGKEVIEKQLLTAGEAYEKALKEAVENGQNYVTVDNETYMIYSVADQKDVPEGTPSYMMLIPHALPATDLKAKDDLTALETINPGVKITFSDYWVTTAGGNEAPSNISTSGINSGKKLKFGGNLGDINSNSIFITKGIVKSDLENGYPILSSNGESLKYLFDETNSTNSKKVHTNDAELKMFISDGKGGYRFDSLYNHALLDKEGNMIVYNLPNTPIKDEGKDQGSQFFPLNTKETFFSDNGQAREYNPNTTRGSATNNGINHYFGAKMTLTYVQPEDGQISTGSGSKEDMVFNFSGDDDFWLFIDGKLVLDIGGIHPAQSGSINFRTGQAITTDGSPSVVDLTKALGSEGWSIAGSKHEMAIFYLERGRNLSNFKMAFNLQIPSHSYAEREAYAVKRALTETSYVYGEHLNYSTTDTPQWTYGVNEKYGVRLTPVGPGPNPDPDPKPDPDPTPDPDPVIPTPNPNPTPEPDPVIPTPDPIQTPDPEPDPELDPILPGKPDKETASKPDMGSSGSQTGKKRSGKSTSSAVGKVGVMGLPGRTNQSGTSTGSSGKAVDGTLYLAKDATRPTSDSQFKYDLTNDGKKARVGEDATSIQTASVLPQTGDSHNSILSIIGMALLTMLGAGLWKRTRKKS
ncbi:MAG: fibro-slime domain-containing protein [Lentilactobacillus diolivorans]|uniref:fibro-slime domain-containing protein n=1 Tax=Lentilactobacillus diolivorans TaxID=179838 RepID=UPI0039E7B8A7